MEQKANNGKGKTIDVPQIFFNEVHIGGNDELQALVIYLSDEKNILVSRKNLFQLVIK
jgi:glutaredoxin